MKNTQSDLITGTGRRFQTHQPADSQQYFDIHNGTGRGIESSGFVDDYIEPADCDAEIAALEAALIECSSTRIELEEENVVLSGENEQLQEDVDGWVNSDGVVTELSSAAIGYSGFTENDLGAGLDSSATATVSFFQSNDRFRSSFSDAVYSRAQDIQITRLRSNGTYGTFQFGLKPEDYGGTEGVAGIFLIDIRVGYINTQANFRSPSYYSFTWNYTP